MKIEELAKAMFKAYYNDFYRKGYDGAEKTWRGLSDVVKSNWLAAARAALAYITEEPGPLADKVESFQDQAARHRLVGEAVQAFQGSLSSFELSLKHAIGSGGFVRPEPKPEDNNVPNQD